MTKPRSLGIAIALVVILLDQISKPLMRDYLDGGDVVLTSFLSLVSAWNKGVGFSLLTMEGSIGPYLLSGLALAISAGLLVWLFRLQRAVPAIALGLVIGGALGNVIDRVRLGAVFDFVDVHAGGYHWPAFNLADSALSIGVVILALDGLFEGRGKGRNAVRPEA